MTSLYDDLLPFLQAISEEGGNFASFLISRPIVEAIDTGAISNPDLARIDGKVREAMAGYRGKRDHRGFSQVFEAYSEGAVYLAAKARGVALTAVSDGAKHGKTPDFRTRTPPDVGFEVKTIDVYDPSRTYDDVMDRGFDAGYAALEESRRAAALSDHGGGVGFGITEFAPHGESVEDPRGAVIQTIRKIRSNVKAGQYAAYPTFLLVSLARLSISTRPRDLRRAYHDAGWAADSSGQLFAIAANRIGDPFYAWSPKRPDISDLGDLGENGILLDGEFIAGMVFVETQWNKLSDPDAAHTAFAFHGVWNSAWETDAPFDAAQKAAAKQAFQALCQHWNDTEAGRDELIPT